MRAILGVLFTFTALVQAASAGSTCQGWVQVDSPRIGIADNVLAAIAANSATDIWAVGGYAPDTEPNLTRTLAQHYDGTQWSVVSTPNVGDKANQLYSVTAALGSAWAVGNYIDDGFVSRSLIEAWDGTRWSIIDHPHLGTSDLFFEVFALSSRNIWAVGFYEDQNGIFRTLIEHFDGLTWTGTPSPNPGLTGNQLNAVLALSSKDVWSVGDQVGARGPDSALIEHWDGTTWSVVDSPPDGLSSTLLYALAGTHGNILAVGSAQNDIQSPRTLVERETNGSFRFENSLSVGSGENDFFGVTTVPGSSVAWAVGDTQNTSTGNLLTLIERYANGEWVQELSPSPGQANGDSLLGGILAVSPTDVWAVGSYDGPNAALPLILHRCQ